MQVSAKAKYVNFSPYKLRPLADVIRGKFVSQAFNWLSVCRMKRVKPIQKVIASAVANAQQKQEVNTSDLIIKDIRIDQGPIVRYFKPGAMGRANMQRKRLCHISVVLEEKKKVDKSTD